MQIKCTLKWKKKCLNDSIKNNLNWIVQTLYSNHGFSSLTQFIKRPSKWNMFSYSILAWKIVWDGQYKNYININLTPLHYFIASKCLTFFQPNRLCTSKCDLKTKPFIYFCKWACFFIAKNALHHQLLQNAYQYCGCTNDFATLQFYLIGFKVTPCSFNNKRC